MMPLYLEEGYFHNIHCSLPCFFLIFIPVPLQCHSQATSSNISVLGGGGQCGLVVEKWPRIHETTDWNTTLNKLLAVPKMFAP